MWCVLIFQLSYLIFTVEKLSTDAVNIFLVFLMIIFLCKYYICNSVGKKILRHVRLLLIKIDELIELIVRENC